MRLEFPEPQKQGAISPRGKSESCFWKNETKHAVVVGE